MLELLISYSKKTNDAVLKILPKVQCAEIWVGPRRCACPQISFTSPAGSELHLSLSAVSHPGFSCLWLASYTRTAVRECHLGTEEQSQAFHNRHRAPSVYKGLGQSSQLVVKAAR